jgi:hypothetical protein
VGNDGFFFELKLAVDGRVQALLGHSIEVSTDHLQRVWQKRTAFVDLPATEEDGHSQSVWQPFRPNYVCSDKKQGGRNVDTMDVLGG